MVTISSVKFSASNLKHTILVYEGLTFAEAPSVQHSKAVDYVTRKVGDLYFSSAYEEGGVGGQPVWSCQLVTWCTHYILFYCSHIHNLPSKKVTSTM